MTATADKLRVYYPSKYLVADGGMLTIRICAAGCTVLTIIDTGLLEVDDYWNGAVGYFLGTTITPALRGVFFHVRDFDAATDTLTLARELPAAPTNFDTYVLILGGNFRSAQETMGLRAGGVFPELVNVSGTNITGMGVKKCSPLLGEGTMTIFFDQSLMEMFMKMGAEPYGPGLDVSVLVSNGIIYGADGEKYVQVDVIPAFLPVSDQTDLYTLTRAERTMTPDYQGYETAASGGKVRYRLEVIKNTDTVETMAGLEAYVIKPNGTDTTIDTGESLGTGAGDFAGVDCSDWPAMSFWVKNTTQNDCRYVFYRSGNRLYCAGAGAGLRGFTATAWGQTDNVVVMSDVDIGLDAPGGSDEFENPADEISPPAGVSFIDSGTDTDTLSIGPLAPGDIYGVWRRETIIENHRARNNIDVDTYYKWT